MLYSRKYEVIWYCRHRLTPPNLIPYALVLCFCLGILHNRVCVALVLHASDGQTITFHAPSADVFRNLHNVSPCCRVMRLSPSSATTTVLRVFHQCGIRSWYTPPGRSLVVTHSQSLNSVAVARMPPLRSWPRYRPDFGSWNPSQPFFSMQSQRLLATCPSSMAFKRSPPSVTVMARRDSLSSIM